jgi:hypothetical protein
MLYHECNRVLYSLAPTDMIDRRRHLIQPHSIKYRGPKVEPPGPDRTPALSSAIPPSPGGQGDRPGGYQVRSLDQAAGIWDRLSWWWLYSPLERAAAFPQTQRIAEALTRSLADA